jgi:hypothetical protein
LLESLALDPAAFRQSRVQPLLEDGWDKIPARFYALIEESRCRPAENKITKDYLANFGRELQPFPGVLEMFERLRQQAHRLIEDIEDKGTAREWNDGAKLIQSQRVANLAPADYSEDSELMQSLIFAVESICKQIALHQLSVGE